jgi:hypothetical protein
MGVTELKRKGRRNKAVANNRTAKIKDLLRKPEVRNLKLINKFSVYEKKLN